MFIECLGTGDTMVILRSLNKISTLINLIFQMKETDNKNAYVYKLIIQKQLRVSVMKKK